MREFLARAQAAVDLTTGGGGGRLPSAWKGSRRLARLRTLLPDRRDARDAGRTSVA
ncbi:hypothetical protein GCM10009641_88430 [Mycobacterium cookii]|uniref:hypothetical protein n=1 Tax=Nocardioides furvisabuli TaxID=375542 RepID=UPI001E39F8A7|nr:hypothetical protein [Nocardioides furvisabuli]